MAIKKNVARCKICGDIIESESVHDFRTCGCGNLSVDGGKCYLRRCIKNMEAYEELSEDTLDDEC